jgi:hypothetical protein
MPKKIKCEDGQDTGWLIMVRGTTLPHREIERCDQCCKCKSDLEAARAFFKTNGSAAWELHSILITRAPIREGADYLLTGFGDERDGKLVRVLAVADNTAIVDAPNYRANVSTDRLEPLV